MPIFVPTQVQDCIVPSFRLVRLVLAHPRNSSPHVKDLIINPLAPTVMFSQVNMSIHMVCPRMWLKLPARFISPSLTSSHLHIFPVTLHFTSSRLVLRIVYWRSLAPIFLVTLHFTSSRLVLRVVYWRGLTPIVPVILYFTSSPLVLRVVYW
jgi:hypothetical protein